MHVIAEFVAAVCAPLVALATSLSWPIAALFHRSPTGADFAVAAIIVSAGAVAWASALWAMGERAFSTNFRQTREVADARSHAALLLRDAIIAGSQESVLVMGADMDAPLSFGGAHELLQTCLSGPDATLLASVIDALLGNGAAFSLIARTPGDRVVAARGYPIGNRAVIYLRETDHTADSDFDYHAVSQALPVPIWLRGRDLRLRWANRAYLTAAGAASLEQAVLANTALDETERELAHAAREGEDVTEVRHHAVVGGRRRALSITMRQLPDTNLVGSAIDVTEAVQAEAKLELQDAVHADVLEQLSTAVAVFGPDHRLMAFNSAYPKMWDLPVDWLRSHPTDGEILDRLRDQRRLPEQRDFAAWKRNQRQLFERVGERSEEFWHLPAGQSLRVVSQPYPNGGQIFLFDDISDRLRLESAYNALLKVQRATLDTLEDAVAIFGPDGRMKLFNRVFADQWGLTDSELQCEPHLNRIAELCAERVGPDDTWAIISTAVNAAAPEHYSDWDRVVRADGKILSISLVRLPDGSTQATLADITDCERFESALAAA